MPDPITAIITATIEHAPSTGAIVAAYKAAKPFLEKILGPGTEELGEMGRDYVKGKRTQNAARTVAEAATLLDATGREAQAVPLKVLDPLLNAASLEEEPTLANKWAALLANAADPAQAVTVQPGFVSILRELTVYDACLLDAVAKANNSRAADVTKAFVNTSDIEKQLPQIPNSAFMIAVDNLVRLNVCATVGTQRVDDGRPHTLLHPFLSAVAPGKETIALTHLGVAFLAACTPPTS